MAYFRLYVLNPLWPVALKGAELTLHDICVSASLGNNGGVWH